MDIIYIRVSTDKKDSLKGQDPYNQLTNLLDFAPKDSIVYEDRQSAWKENIERIEFNKIKDLIKKGKVRGLYVWDLDRLYRNRKNLINFFEYLPAFCFHKLKLKPKRAAGTGNAFNK